MLLVKYRYLDFEIHVHDHVCGLMVDQISNEEIFRCEVQNNNSDMTIITKAMQLPNITQGNINIVKVVRRLMS